MEVNDVGDIEAVFFYSGHKSLVMKFTSIDWLTLWRASKKKRTTSEVHTSVFIEKREIIEWNSQTPYGYNIKMKTEEEKTRIVYGMRIKIEIETLPKTNKWRDMEIASRCYYVYPSNKFPSIPNMSCAAVTARVHRNRATCVFCIVLMSISSYHSTELST